MIFEWISIVHSKIIKFLLHPCYTLIAKKASDTNVFSLYGIQEVAGSSPAISTIWDTESSENPVKSRVLGIFLLFLFSKIFANFLLLHPLLHP